MSVALAVSSAWFGQGAAEATVLQRMTVAYEGIVSGNFASTGNTVLTCSTTSGVNASHCSAARSRTGEFLDNDSYSMVNVKVPFASMSSSNYFNASNGSLVIPADAQVIHATLFWTGSMRLDAGDVSAPDASAKHKVLFARAGDDCSVTGNPCQVTAETSDVYQVENGTKLGPYRASADITDLLTDDGITWTASGPSKSLLLSVANIQTTAGVNKTAGWGVMAVYSDPNESPHHIEILKGLGYESNIKDDEFGFDGFQTAASGNVLSEVGFVGIDGDAGSARDAMAISDAEGSAAISDLANPDNNIANSTVAMNGEISSYLNDSSIGRHSNTFGIDVDRISLVNGLSKEVSYADLIPSAYGDSFYISGLALSNEITSPDLELIKSVSSVTGGDPNLVEVGDTIVYEVEVSNVGQAHATNVLISDVLPADLGSVTSTGSDCQVVPVGEICKSLGTLRSGSSTSISITATLTGTSQVSPGRFSNFATATFSGVLGEQSAVSNEVTVEYGVLAIDLSSSVAFSSDFIQAGRTSSFVASVTNHGVVADSNPSIRLKAQDGAKLLLVKLPTGCQKTATTTLVCSAAALGISAQTPLNPGDKASVRFRVIPSRTMSSLQVWGTAITGVSSGDTDNANNVSDTTLYINHKPKAKPATAVTTAGGPKKNIILGSKISDSDGDSLHVTIGKVAHGKAAVVGDVVSYTPPKNWTGSFRIAYKVTDGKGGTARSWIKIFVTSKSGSTVKYCLKSGC